MRKLCFGMYDNNDAHCWSCPDRAECGKGGEPLFKLMADVVNESMIDIDSEIMSMGGPPTPDFQISFLPQVSPEPFGESLASKRERLAEEIYDLEREDPFSDRLVALRKEMDMVKRKLGIED
jgi:hypothetical protein